MFGVQQVSDMLQLHRLPDHAHVLVVSTIACQLIYWVGYYFFEFSRNRHFVALSPIKKIDWALHIVSSVHALLICFLAAPIFGDPALEKDRVFGYSTYAGNVYAIACGYFLWDTIISIYYIKQFGVGFALHGIACLAVFGLCFKPFLMYYGAVFLLFELSTPFLNLHWFCDKTNRTGSLLQMINGVLLVSVFFFARIVFGFYQSGHFFVDVYDRREEIPALNVWVYSIANVLLNGLNVFWLTKMVTAMRKRFSPNKSRKSAAKRRGQLSNGTLKSNSE